MEGLDRVQNRFSKKLLGLKGTNCKERLDKLVFSLECVVEGRPEKIEL